MRELLNIIVSDLWPWIAPAAVGLLLSWSTVQTVKMIRRDFGRTKLLNIYHRAIAMVFAGMGTGLTVVVIDLNRSLWVEVAYVVVVALCSPNLFALLLAMTKGKKGVLGNIHFLLRGERRRNSMTRHPNRREEDNNSSWWN